MKTYWLVVGDSSNPPSTYSGLSPTMMLFADAAGGTAVGPSIVESPAGSGLYRFAYGPTLGMAFTVDWGLTVPSGFRYTTGGLDPIQAVDERVGGILDNNDSFGTTVIDPSTVIGFLKRLQELLEGNAQYIKESGTWNISSRGSSTLLRTKTLSNDTTQATKT